MNSNNKLPIYQRIRDWITSPFIADDKVDTGRHWDDLPDKAEMAAEEVIEASPDEVLDATPKQPPETWEGLLHAIDDIDTELYETSMSRQGGGWSTGSCVVGADMHTGLVIAMQQVRMYRVDAKLSLQENKDCLVAAINEVAKHYTGHDSEGYVVGTIITVARRIDDMVLT